MVLTRRCPALEGRGLATKRATGQMSGLNVIPPIDSESESLSISASLPIPAPLTPSWSWPIVGDCKISEISSGFALREEHERRTHDYGGNKSGQKKTQGLDAAISEL